MDQQRKAVAALFDATSEELGEAAVAQAQEERITGVKVVRRNGTDEEVSIEVINLEDLDVPALTAGTELNFLVAAKVEDWVNVGMMFGPMDPGEIIILVEPEKWNWPRLLAFLGCFPSKSQAAKNLKSQGKSLDFEKGWTDFHIGKARKLRICLWDPYMPEKL